MATITDRVSKSALCSLGVNIITQGTGIWADTLIWRFKGILERLELGLLFETPLEIQMDMACMV